MDIRNIMKSGEKILKGFKIDGIDRKPPRKLTNKVLLEELVEHFSAQLEELSVGEKMLYPMEFNVLMHPEDHEQRHESFPFMLPQVVQGFYKIIRNRRNKYPDYDPTAKEWRFMFSPCQLEEIEQQFGENITIRKGEITTLARLVSLDMSQGNTKVETNVRFSVKPQNSAVFGNTNINMEAIRNLDFKGNSSFSFAFDKNLNPDTNAIIADSNIANIKGWATLTYSQGPLNTHYNMKDSLIHISGKNETRKSRSIFILESESVIDSHVQIRVIQDKKQLFQIAAFGETRLNGRALELSEGGTLNWYNLPDNSQIFMNGTVAVKFKINQ